MKHSLAQECSFFTHDNSTSKKLKMFSYKEKVLKNKLPLPHHTLSSKKLSQYLFCWGVGMWCTVPRTTWFSVFVFSQKKKGCRCILPHKRQNVSGKT